MPAFSVAFVDPRDGVARRSRRSAPSTARPTAGQSASTAPPTSRHIDNDSGADPPGGGRAHHRGTRCLPHGVPARRAPRPPSGSATCRSASCSRPPPRARGAQAVLGHEPAGGVPAAPARAVLRRRDLRRGLPGDPRRRGRGARCEPTRQSWPATPTSCPRPPSSSPARDGDDDEEAKRRAAGRRCAHRGHRVGPRRHGRRCSRRREGPGRSPGTTARSDERLIAFSNAQPSLYDWSLDDVPGRRRREDASPTTGALHARPGRRRRPRWPTRSIGGRAGG